MAENRVKIPFPTPTSPKRDGVQVPVGDSTEKWTDVNLLDGTQLRLKASIIGAIRIEGEYDAAGNPAYTFQVQNMVTIVSTPDALKRPSPGPVVQ
jgi:hypothetical protein